MRYYLLTDTHGFFDLVLSSLKESGYYDYEGQKLIVICGDLLDRGEQVKELEQWAFEGLKNGKLILVRGNHEDLAVDFVNRIHHYLNADVTKTHHYKNGTVQTFLRLTNFRLDEALSNPLAFYRACKNTTYFKSLIPLSQNYYETKNHLFVHGWIPYFWVDEDCNRTKIDWRTATEEQWKRARWDNGMSLADLGLILEDKTVVCGHHSCSYGHSVINGVGSEHGKDAVYDPYYAKGIISFDACSVISNKMNCLVIDDDEI